MYKAPYFKSDGSKGRARALPEWLFDGVVNEPVLHQAVKAYLANQRQGTAAAKNRSAVAGGSRKPWRQKGTGRARQGTTRAAQWTGGGLAFPPQPHSWRQKLPKKVRALAHRSALNARADGEQVLLIDAIELDAPKTATIRDLLLAVEATGKVLILTDGVKSNVHLSARNLQGVEVRPFGQESTYDVLWAGTLVIERSALEAAQAPSATEAAVEAPAEAEADESVEDADAAPAAEAVAEADAAVETDEAAAPEAEEATEPTDEAQAEPVAEAEVEAATSESDDADADADAEETKDA